MSTIGRIFIISNLVFAAVFVGFTATYLQQADNYKGLYEESQTASAQLKKELEDQVSAANNRASTLDTKLAQSQTNLKRTETRNSELADENQRLANQLSQLDGAMQQMKSDLGTMSSTIERSTSEYTSSVKLALAAQKERDDAVRARVVAEKDLADANNTIAQLNSTIEVRNASIASANDKIAEQGILIANVRAKVPAAMLNDLATPDLKGTVRHVAGKLLTIVVTDNPADAEIMKGITFAVAGNGQYKGEALVTEVDGNTAFCRMTITNGNDISVGDAALTHTH